MNKTPVHRRGRRDRSTSSTRAIEDLRRLGATIVDPGPTGALFQSCVDKYVPKWRNQQFIAQFPALFPQDAAGAPAADHIATLLDMFFDPTPRAAHGARAAEHPQPRRTGGTDTGDGRYNFNAYIRERGDAAIKSLDRPDREGELLERPGDPEPQAEPDEHRPRSGRWRTRARCRRASRCRRSCSSASRSWTSTPSSIRRATSRRRSSRRRQEPTVNDRSSGLWTYINSRGFPAMTVPAGFTTQVYDRAADGTLLPPKAAALPVGHRLPRPAVQRAEAVRDRRRVRGGDAAPHAAARLRAARRLTQDTAARGASAAGRRSTIDRCKPRARSSSSPSCW